MSFTSNLTVAEHHAIRSVGFTPVGQVLGSCVYAIGYTGTWNCGYGWSGGFGGAPSRTVEATGLRDSLYTARTTAMQRMQAEAAALGGDGIVAVRLTVAGSRAPGWSSGPSAPRSGPSATSGRRGRSPRTCRARSSPSWSPRAGCRPTLALGIAVRVRHDDWQTRHQNSAAGNKEVAGYTDLVTQARADARGPARHDCTRAAGATA